MLMQSFANTREIIVAALLISLGICLNIAESIFILPLPLPGVKIGFANIILLISLYVFSLRIVTSILFLRILVASFLLGTFFSPTFFISLSGGILSIIVMFLLKRYTKGATIIGISVAGVAAHNSGQLFYVAFLLGSTKIFYYFPFLLVLSIPIGLFTGWVAKRGLFLLDINMQNKSTPTFK